jgi:hypothetical protein
LIEPWSATGNKPIFELFIGKLPKGGTIRTNANNWEIDNVLPLLNLLHEFDPTITKRDMGSLIYGAVHATVDCYDRLR